MGWVTSPSNWGVPYWFRSFSQGLYVPEFKEAHTAYKLILDNSQERCTHLAGVKLSQERATAKALRVAASRSCYQSRILNNQDES